MVFERGFGFFAFRETQPLNVYMKKVVFKVLFVDSQLRNHAFFNNLFLIFHDT